MTAIAAGSALITETEGAVTEYGPCTTLQQNDRPTERLIVVPEPVTDLRPNRAARFSARLESSGEVVVLSHQPLADGARELLDRGLDRATLLTMRREGKAYDSFRPTPIVELARWTYSESEMRPLRCRPWEAHPDKATEMPVAVPGEGQKSGSKGVAGIQASAGQNFVRASPHDRRANRARVRQHGAPRGAPVRGLQ
jgi:hypothetical protein